jgi:3-dehydroquinate synthase
MQTVRVELGKRSYDILIGFDMLEDIGPALAEHGLLSDNMAVLTSPTIGAHYYQQVRDSLERAGAAVVDRHDIPDGEDNKSLDEFCRAVRRLAQFAPNPAVRPTVLALGGGVVGDLGGFAAASFRRGVPYVQVPTTLLSAVDSSVGGKTAVNLPEGKNLCGAFYQPSLVYMDLATLDTLPGREVRSGVAEVIKYGAILDADLFQYLEESIEALIELDAEALTQVVPTCVELKAEVVGEDERENAGVRICLNFGHTIGHAIEKAAAGALSHGEAVAVGMVAAARLSVQLNLCDSDVEDRLSDMIERAGLPVTAPGLRLETVLDYLRHDKKFITGANRFILLEDIGAWTCREGVDMDAVRDITRSVLL